MSIDIFCFTCGAVPGEHTDGAHEPNYALSLMEAVKQYAADHYNEGGWDVVVECYDDAELIAQIGDAESLEAALDAFRPAVSVWADRQADAERERHDAIGCNRTGCKWCGAHVDYPHLPGTLHDCPACNLN